jgi:hypothetical protein
MAELDVGMGDDGQAGQRGQGGQGGQGRPAMRWTPVMSAFVLKMFADLVCEWVKTDKGFKEVHVNVVARQVPEFSGVDVTRVDVTGTQVYNHLHKWHQRWVKVCKLKDLSGALWNEDNCCIVLDEEHLLGHYKVISYHFSLDIVFFNPT